MSKERIGRFERWILTHCYLKMIKKELPLKWKFPRLYEDTENFKRVLWKSEVLLNYFTGLKLSKKKAGTIALEKFKVTKEYKGALASFTRTANYLGKKDYVLLWRDKYRDSIRAFSLTKPGKAKAEKILRVNIGNVNI